MAAAQAMFPGGDQAPQVISNSSATTVVTVDGSEGSDNLGYLLLANAIAMLVFTCAASFILRMAGASWEDLRGVWGRLGSVLGLLAYTPLKLIRKTIDFDSET